MDTNNPIYVAVDSDVLRFLTELNWELKRNSAFNTMSSDNKLIREYGGYLRTLLEKIKNDEIRIVVPTMVFSEVKNRPDCLSFIKDYCYCPDINMLNFYKRMEEIDKIAREYCSRTYTIKGKTYYPPMHVVSNATDIVQRPSLDAYIMAEATYENLILVTANGKDFIFDRNVSTDKNSKAAGIYQINMSLGYADDQGNCPKPMYLPVFGALLKDLEHFRTTVPTKVVKVGDLEI
ncbi:MAG: type II toxin-antitoxin system VapC family toxin [Clostridiales bacterium]|nr:type II toxin-antitoxin system VapC family toxin [Clostridiales bacterium]